jgi:hypothetical protein
MLTGVAAAVKLAGRGQLVQSTQPSPATRPADAVCYLI